MSVPVAEVSVGDAAAAGVAVAAGAVGVAAVAPTEAPFMPGVVVTVIVPGFV
jgi:anti-sigma factor RsiW